MLESLIKKVWMDIEENKWVMLPLKSIAGYHDTIFKMRYYCQIAELEVFLDLPARLCCSIRELKEGSVKGQHLKSLLKLWAPISNPIVGKTCVW